MTRTPKTRALAIAEEKTGHERLGRKAMPGRGGVAQENFLAQTARTGKI